MSHKKRKTSSHNLRSDELHESQQEQDATQLFHKALRAIVEGNLSQAHDCAVAAAAIYHKQGSKPSAELALRVAEHPEEFALAS
ncbi:MAG TPA: hypothetical protein PKB15_07000 [Acidimicrobiia bacterium]|nr:hypothetical protein [Acidimicrobiia bacterium]